MEYTLVDGRSAPEEGELVRIRVLRDADGEIAADRPYRDHPVELSADTEIVIPDELGTYEIRGTLRRAMLAEASGSDFLFLDDHHVENVATELVELPHKDVPDWKHTDATDADVDVDIDSVMTEEEAAKQSDAHPRPTLGEAESLSENLNDLVLDQS